VVIRRPVNVFILGGTLPGEMVVAVTFIVPRSSMPPRCHRCPAAKL